MTPVRQREMVEYLEYLAGRCSGATTIMLRDYAAELRDELGLHGPLKAENERLRSALEEIMGWESAACNGRNDLTARLAGIAKRALEAE